jgi:FkbM family methyltransferase
MTPSGASHLRFRRWMETVRIILHGALGARSPLYKLGSVLLAFASVTRKEGLGAWFALRAIETRNAPGLPPESVRLRALKYPFLLRPGTEDVGMIINTIIREEYGQFRLRLDPQWIIDAGAYIGDTSAYWLSRYPRLRVVALEPNPPAFDMAQQNLAPYGDRAVLLPKALYARDQYLKFGGEFGGASIQASGRDVEAISIPTLLEMFAIPRVNILKMDIEGAEEAIFASHSDTWLQHVDQLIIELHGTAAKAIVSRALQQSGFAMRQYRSVWYCMRLP